MMLLSLGTTFMIGVLYINLVTAPISTPILTMKNCTHIEFVSEVSFVQAFHQLTVHAILSNSNIVNIGYAGLTALKVVIDKGDGFQNETILTPSPNTIAANADPFNLTLLFEFPAKSTSYQFDFTITDESIRKVTDVYKKSACTPSDTSIFCENACLCDTVIYKICANGDRVNGICSDPGTLFQSPGNLTFNGECPPVTCNTSSLLVNNLIPISSPSINVKPNETVMFQCDENQGYKGNIATYNCSDHGSFILISSPANCYRGLSPGAIAGIVIGVIVGLIIFAAVVYLVLQKKKKVEYPKSAEESPLNTTNT